MTSSRPRLICFLFALLLPLLNCGGSAHDPTEKYYLVATNIKLPYWQAAFNGLSRAATQLKVQAEFVGPETYDPQAEVQDFQRIARQAKKPAGILVSPADPKLMAPEINAAIDAGIPVITIDSDSPESKRLLFIGTNKYQAGHTGGEVAAKQLKGKGSVVIFAMPEQANLNQRLSGYRDAFASHPGIKIEEVVNHKGDPRLAFDMATQIIEKRRNKVDAFVSLEATAGKEIADVLERGHVKDKVVIAMDTDKETLEWIQKGVIAATIAQKPFTMAFYGVKMLDDLYHHKLNPLGTKWSDDFFSPLPTFVDTGSTLIEKNNVDVFMKARDNAAQQ